MDCTNTTRSARGAHGAAAVHAAARFRVLRARALSASVSTARAESMEGTPRATQQQRTQSYTGHAYVPASTMGAELSLQQQGGHGSVYTPHATARASHDQVRALAARVSTCRARRGTEPSTTASARSLKPTAAWHGDPPLHLRHSHQARMSGEAARSNTEGSAASNLTQVFR